MNTVEEQPLEDVVDLLLDLDDEDFQDAVSREVKGQSDSRTAEALRHDDVLDRWHEMLTGLMLQVGSQVASRKGQYDTESKAWRGAALRFNASVVTRRKECKALLTERNREENVARWTIPPPVPSANTKERRGIAGEIALQRLCDLHGDDFKRLLAEEYLRAGLPVKAHWLGDTR